MLKNILCAVDGSGHLLRAAAEACEMATQSGGAPSPLTATRPLKGSDEARAYLERESLLGEATCRVAPCSVIRAR